MNAKPLLLACALALTSAAAWAEPDAINSDAVLPNSPYKAQGMPDAGEFNPTMLPPPKPRVRRTAPPRDRTAPGTARRGPKPYALVPAPTLPCAPGYCPVRAARVDRN
ncbi:hypothetical protein EII20_03815 [Comamonadaceae bacterium OH2545_COT-014]|nr:hypothetical protein EII20_03815 [Comamonadaceae bacterium OH2545_COT-014]